MYMLPILSRFPMGKSLAKIGNAPYRTKNVRKLALRCEGRAEQGVERCEIEKEGKKGA